MRKSLWMMLVVFVFMVLGTPSAHADGIVVLTGGYVTAIDDITLNGALYDVTFTGTIDNTFSAYPYDSPTITGIISAIDSDLGSTNINDETGDSYAIAGNGGVAAEALNGAPWYYLGGVTDTAYAEGVEEDPSTAFWANFTPAVAATPEPGTLSITLTGVGLLGLWVAMRKRVGLRHPQST